jgi:adenine-specific DNA methylase
VTDDKRLIEDYLPIVAISAEASREKSVRKGHISTLHLWWARRPLVACRAAVYGGLVPSSRFVPNGASDEKRNSLGRANASKFVQRLCRYPTDSKPDEKADIHSAVRKLNAIFWNRMLNAFRRRVAILSPSRISSRAALRGRGCSTCLPAEVPSRWRRCD